MVCDIEPALLSVRETARLLNVSQRQIWKLLGAGRLPRPRRIGRSVRFIRSDLARWLELDCPSGEDFEALRGNGRGRSRA